MKILLVDNFDSFTYNLLHLIEQFENLEIKVERNNEISPDDVSDYDRIIISPGPGVPSEAGVTLELIRKYAGVKPILGVCLGMQAIVEAFGGTLINLPIVFHGVAENTYITDKTDPLFQYISSPFKCGRYHSWVVNPIDLPPSFKVTAKDDSGNLMAITHENELLRGIQFHPESILTDSGKLLMDNWLHRC